MFKERETSSDVCAVQNKGRLRLLAQIEDQMLRFKGQADRIALFLTVSGSLSAHAGILVQDSEFVKVGVMAASLGFALTLTFHNSLRRYIKRYNID